jgi:hypothetical protein
MLFAECVTAYANHVSNIACLLVVDHPAVAVAADAVESQSFERTCDSADEQVADLCSSPLHP